LLIFKKYIVAEIVLFSIVTPKILTFHKAVTHLKCGGIYNNSFITNCLLIPTVKKFEN